MSVNAACQRSSTTIEHTGPSKLPRLGQSRRERHGVCIVPIKKMSASVRDGSSTATSPMRNSVLTSDGLSLIATKWQAVHTRSSGTTKSASPASQTHNAAVTALISV
jgi:hypothetical protein